jgi:ribose 5-phosphate isomerase B
MLYISSDHGGFNLKSELIKYFSQNGIEFEDLGPTELVQDDDYNDYVLPLVERVRSYEGSNGILLCRNGVGVNMLANKFNGIRAALSFDSKHAASSRNDDHTNVLTLPSDYINNDKAIEIVKTWLNTPYSQDERHIRRVNSVDQYGQK